MITEKTIVDEIFAPIFTALSRWRIRRAIVATVRDMSLVEDEIANKHLSHRYLKKKWLALCEELRELNHG